jgi:hypothetical protein
MTKNLPIEASMHAKPSYRPTRPLLRADADKALRDIAFVLKMTQRVRAEIEAEEEAEELVPA